METVGIADLDIELLALILEFVGKDSPDTLKSVSLVNKLFNATSSLVVHRQRKIAYRQDWGLPVPNLQPILDDDVQIRGIRYLTIEHNKDCRNDDRRTAAAAETNTSLTDAELEDNKWSTLTQLISRLGNLKCLTWTLSGMPPIQVLDALHRYQPKAELKVYDFARSNASDDHNQPNEIALSKSPALTAIKTRIWTKGADIYPDLRSAAFRRIVANAPNLKFASVIKGHSGCAFRGLDVDELNELKKKKEKFMNHTRPNSSVRTLTLDGYSLSKDTLENWGKIVDVSKLESLKCSRGWTEVSYFKAAPDLLPNLKHVHLNLQNHNDRNIDAAIENYLTTCAPLKTMSLWSWMASIPLSPLITRHGPTLKSLQLHEREDAGRHPSHLRKVISLEQLSDIKAKCPLLQTFTFDLSRVPNWDEAGKVEEMDKITLLKTMNLDSLEIYYDLGIAYLQCGPIADDYYGAEQFSSDEDVDDEEDYAEASGESVMGSDGQELNDDSAEDESEVVEPDTNSNNIADTDQTSPSPSGINSPARKRQKLEQETAEGVVDKQQKRKRENLRPLTNSMIESKVREIWKQIFGDRPTGSRTLKVKYGEWERKIGAGNPCNWLLAENAYRTFWQVKPNVRDDLRHECVVVKYGSGLEDGETLNMDARTS